MWDQKHWKWKYPYRIAELVLILVFLALNLLFPALEFHWKLLAALAAGAVTAIAGYVWRKKHPEPEEENKDEDNSNNSNTSPADTTQEEPLVPVRPAATKHAKHTDVER